MARRELHIGTHYLCLASPESDPEWLPLQTRDKLLPLLPLMRKVHLDGSPDTGVVGRPVPRMEFWVGCRQGPVLVSWR